MMKCTLLAHFQLIRWSTAEKTGAMDNQSVGQKVVMPTYIESVSFLGPHQPEKHDNGHRFEHTFDTGVNVRCGKHCGCDEVRASEISLYCFDELGMSELIFTATR